MIPQAPADRVPATPTVILLEVGQSDVADMIQTAALQSIAGIVKQPALLADGEKPLNLCLKTLEVACQLQPETDDIVGSDCTMTIEQTVLNTGLNQDGARVDLGLRIKTGDVERGEQSFNCL